jgi:hypothetical protein
MSPAPNLLARSTRRLAPIALLALTWASPALAQSPDEQQAEALFREGRDAIDHGDFNAGCAKFAASLRLTQRPGPLLNLANCEEHQGRLVSALAHWTDGIALLPKTDERIASARDRVEALGRRIPRLTVTLAPSPPTGTKVTLDGATLSPAALGLPSPLDLGEHTLIASAPGHADGKQTLVLAEGERREITIFPGDALPAVVTPPPPPPVVEKPIVPVEPPPSSSGGARTAGFVVGGAGVVSLAIGAITGVMTIGKKNAVEEACGGPTGPCLAANPADVRSLEKSGITLSTVSTVTFIVGAVGLGAGVTLVLLGGRRRAPTTATLTPLVSTSGGGLSMQGSF